MKKTEEWKCDNNFSRVYKKMATSHTEQISKYAAKIKFVQLDYKNGLISKEKADAKISSLRKEVASLQVNTKKKKKVVVGHFFGKNSKRKEMRKVRKKRKS